MRRGSQAFVVLSPGFGIEQATFGRLQLVEQRGPLRRMRTGAKTTHFRLSSIGRRRDLFEIRFPFVDAQQLVISRLNDPRVQAKPIVESVEHVGHEYLRRGIRFRPPKGEGQRA